MQYFRFLSFTLIVALTGCSAIVSPDGSALDPDGPPADAGADAVVPPTDSSVPPSDSSVPPADSSVPDSTVPPADSSVPPDASCTGPARCEGNVLVSCVAGRRQRLDCGGDVCNAATASCEPPAGFCTPGSRRCLNDRESAVCNADGLSETPVACPFSCNAATGACMTDPPPPTCGDLPVVEDGDTHRIDLCSTGDDETHQPDGDGCPATSRADSGDAIFELLVDRRRRVRIDLRDDDSAAIDTIVYVRNSCTTIAGVGAQIACSDDIPCADSDISTGCPGGGGGTQVRQSIIDETFEAGTYYIVVDAFEYTTGGGSAFECGQVRLSVDFP